ncbi:cilia- and flagella-associated protein 53 isoform X3 [Desmodus rotundus]|uniref:cilia- and flagella-associated protein 53 isoform X3 n=1 Tax=Desmodus rotundus TaxID=9430 RepID=UPI00238141A1|nr:cilia- and flagella-associated protein 53 isoform X3 [Desmodus rotundus]
MDLMVALGGATFIMQATWRSHLHQGHPETLSFPSVIHTENLIVRAKPPKAQRAEQHLERIRRNYQKHQAVLDSIKSIERDRLRVDWHQHNDCKFVKSLVKARLKDATQGFIISTEERRNKLRELLASEENKYFTEMQSKEETIEERKDKMKEKIRLIKEKKEKERQDFVAEKLDQQFRERCEELRSELSCIHQKKVCEERQAQVEFNKELKRQKLAEEQMFSKLWEEDRLAKEKRDGDEARRQKELVENTRLGLNAQVTAIQAQRLAAQQQKEEEARLVEAIIREQKTYRQYLAQCREEENAQEKELDRILEEEKAKKLAEKDKQLKLEKEARKQLVNEVMCTRKLQVQEKLQRKAKEKEERSLEQEHINEGLKELNREERENFERRSNLAREYRKQLQMQMSYQQQAREAEKEEERREVEAGMAANKVCQDKIQELLCAHRVQLRNVHPMRRACSVQFPP